MKNWLSNKIKFIYAEYLFHNKNISTEVSVRFDASEYYLKSIEVDSWLQENCKGSYDHASSFFSFNILRPGVKKTQGVKIKFAQKGDAILFKLVWGDK